jgi:hypothetical protein
LCPALAHKLAVPPASISQSSGWAPITTTFILSCAEQMFSNKNGRQINTKNVFIRIDFSTFLKVSKDKKTVTFSANF